jgi:hypothetical protein
VYVGNVVFMQSNDEFVEFDLQLPRRPESVFYRVTNDMNLLDEAATRIESSNPDFAGFQPEQAVIVTFDSSFQVSMCNWKSKLWWNLSNQELYPPFRHNV